MKKSISFAMAMGWVFSLSFAGPITTVPWNGHPGAASFTFDDGLHSQTNNLTFLNSMKDVTVTFFVCTRSMDFGTNSQPHLEYASKGHEIGNHTANHKNLTETTDYNTEISGAASTLRGMKRADGTNLQVTSLATPYCAQNQGAKNAINQEHFINRGCGGSGLTGWDNEPDWMQIDSHYWQSGNSVQTFQGSFDQAATGKWHVQLNHGVGGDWDAISAADIKTLIEYAVSKNLWVASFSTVGAYLRAHFTIDKATSTTTSTGFKVTWTSPHAHMPKSVPLRVNIEGAAGKTVTQKGVVVPQNSDGTYTIEFMTLELEVGASGTNPTSSSSTQPGSSASQPGSSTSVITNDVTVQMEDYDQGGQGVAYNDLNYSEMEKYVTYRTDDAGIVSAGDGYAIGYTKTGEWFNYTMSVPCTGQYKVLARASTGNSSNTKFTISAVGAEPLQVSVSPTTSWDIYAEIDAGTVRLTEGSNSFKVSIDDDNVNVDWIKFIADGVQCPGMVPPQSSASGDNSSASGGDIIMSNGSSTAPASSSASSDPQGNVSDDTPEAIPMVGDIHWIDFSGEIYCQVFDMKGQLLRAKSGAASQGAAGLWNAANKGLPKGVYIMRYGRPGSIRTIQVRK